MAMVLPLIVVWHVVLPNIACKTASIGGNTVSSNITEHQSYDIICPCQLLAK